MGSEEGALAFKGSRSVWLLRRKYRHADQEAQKVSGSKGSMFMSLRVAASWNIFTDEGGGRGRTKQYLLCRERRRCRNGMGRRCLWCCLVTVETGCQEETQKKKAEKKRSKRMNVDRDMSERKLFRKWLRALRKRQGRR